MLLHTYTELDPTIVDNTRLQDFLAGRQDNGIGDLVLGHRSARLNVAVSQKLAQQGRHDEARAIFSGVDWAREPTIFVATSSQRQNRPLFTVLIATFNAAKDLPATLRSIRGQGRHDIECIVMDGGSKDDTLDVVRAWSDVVTECFSQPDNGLYDALNKGLQLARGTLIGIVGAGDCYLPGALDAVANAHYQNMSDVYGGQTLELGKDGQLTKRHDEPWGVNAFVSGGPVGHNGMFATRQAYDAVGLFGTTYPMAEDTRWMHRAIRAQRTFTYVAQPVVLFPLTGMSNSNPDLVWQEAHGLIKQNFPEIDIERQDALDLLFGARAWKPASIMTPVLRKYDHLPLNISAAAALRAQDVPVETMLEVLDDIKWDEVTKLYNTNGMRFADTSPPKNPLLSIVLPSYNVGQYLGRVLNSILLQDFEDLEVIIVDDGATDYTLAVAKAFAALDGRVRIHSQENGGLAQARLSGLNLCNGQYVWFVDSDDFLREDCLGRIARVLEDQAPDAYFINYALIDEDDVVRNERSSHPQFTGMIWNPSCCEARFTAVAGWSSQTWRFIVKRSVIEENSLSFPVGYYYEDHHFALSLASVVDTIFIDPAVSYYYLQRSGSIMTDRSRRVFDFLHIRRMCLTFLQEAGLFHKMPGLTLSYIMPVIFITHVVDADYQEEFTSAILSDLTADELLLMLRHGGSAEFELLKDLCPTWCERLANWGPGAKYHPLLMSSYTTQIATASAQEGFHPLSRTLRSHQVVGLWDVEDGTALEGCPDAFAWSDGRDLFVRVELTGYGRPVFSIKLRNALVGQVLLFETKGFISSFPCVDADISIPRSYKFPLDVSEAFAVVHIRAISTSVFQGRDLGFIVESIDVYDEDLEAFLPPMVPRNSTPTILAGKESQVGTAHVDIRVQKEDRPYVIIGDNSDVGGTYVFERGVGSISIGDGSSIGGGCLLICTQPDGIHIGDNVMLSWDVVVMDSNAHSLDYRMRNNDAEDWLTGKTTNRLGAFKTWYDVASAPVRIEDEAWIGFGSLIMKGVTIGQGAIVASHSVVTKDVPPYAIVAGNPARVVSRNDAVYERLQENAKQRFPDNHPIPTVTFTASKK